MGLRTATLVVSIAILFIVVEFLRRRTLREKYAVTWLIVAIGQAVLAAWPPLLDLVSTWLGVKDPPNLLAFIGIVFLLGIVAHLSIESSTLEDETRRLSEEVAILRHHVEELSTPLATNPQQPGNNPGHVHEEEE